MDDTKCALNTAINFCIEYTDNYMSIGYTKRYFLLHG
jgi:hypothetical protein